jgi:hypothetical protein
MFTAMRIIDQSFNQPDALSNTTHVGSYAASCDVTADTCTQHSTSDHYHHVTVVGIGPLQHSSGSNFVYLSFLLSKWTFLLQRLFEGLVGSQNKYLLLSLASLTGCCGNEDAVCFLGDQMKYCSGFSLH